MIVDLKAWLLFGLGALCSLIAFADSFLIFDPYPGYGALEKRRAAAHEAYIRRKNDLIARLLEIRDAAIEILEEANRDLSIRRSEYDLIIEGRTRFVRLFVAHQSHLERSANALLAVYREANKAARKSAPPARFRGRLTGSRSFRRGGAPHLCARGSASLDRESQTVLVRQVEDVHAEFERQFASYREIDDLIEESTVVRSNAKAA